MYGASHQARSAAAMTPVPAKVCKSLRRDSEVRSSILETSRWPGLSGSWLRHHAIASRAGKAANGLQRSACAGPFRIRRFLASARSDMLDRRRRLGCGRSTRRGGSMASTMIGKQAVVIGAGMAGLTAAGALADRFDRVVVLERDTLPSEPTYRAGTPQARHVHALLLSGQRALSELFPGFEQDLARAGAVPLRAGLDVRIERPGYDPFPQRDLGWFSYAVSRPAIEYAVRRRVESLANTTLRQRCRVLEVLASPNGETVTGVRCENDNGTSDTIAADLVI